MRPTIWARPDRIGAAAPLVGLLIGLGVAGGCSAPVPMPHATPVVSAPVTAFDGRYRGVLQVTGAATGLDPRSCAPDSRLDFEVRNGRFGLTVTHPSVAAATPGLREVTTVAYDVTVAADGAVTGIADSTNTNLVGRVSGTRMTGQIYGLLCYYAFSAERG
jgi:hypothetical protein